LDADERGWTLKERGAEDGAVSEVGGAVSEIKRTDGQMAEEAPRTAL